MAAKGLEPADPTICTFCEGVDPPPPSVGRMLVVVMESGTELLTYEDSQFGACEPCARAYSGRCAGTNAVTGETAIFQFQHEDFHKVEDQVDSFSVYLDSLKCKLCNDKIYEEGALLTKIARRMLQNCPDVARLDATCGPCTDERGCPDCDNHSSPDHDHN